jgi:hypothetical protein
MNNSLKALLFFGLICLARSHYEGATCRHTQHQEEYPPQFLDIEEDFSALELDRNLQTVTYNPIRIYATYDNLANSSSDTYTSYVQNDLAPAVISWFQGALKVKYPVSGNLKLSSSISSLCGMDVPAALRTGVAADYVIMFDSRSEDSTVVASSRFCYLASDSKRPLIATTNFNQVMFKEANGDVILHEKNTYLLLHEMTHTFGFSSSLYGYFLDANGKQLSGHVKTINIAGDNHTVVNVPPLTDKLRTFHGCSTIPGGIMENDGGSGTDGSHFEKKFYLFDTMATGSASGKRHSELSLALLEGSGWYVIDYTYAEPYFYGQGEGCDFIFGTCNTTSNPFDEFCLGSNWGCSSQGHSGGRCSSDDKTDGCRYVLPSNNYHCQNPDAVSYARLPNVEVYDRAANSKCFTGTLSTRSSTSLASFCFNFTCVGSGISTQLNVILGKTTAVCKKQGTLTVSGYYGSIDCPDPLTFCSTIGVVYCPRNCMGRGTCVNNKCVCNTGFTGIDCALTA